MIRVGSSAGKGRGVFATRNIAKGEIIEEASVIVVPEEQVAHLDATVLGDYYFLWGVDEKQAAVLLGTCSLCNHSYTPNAEFTLHANRMSIAFTALRDIAADEEITTNYNGDPTSQKPVWFPTAG